MSEADTLFFNRILSQIADEYAKKSPGTSITKVKDEAMKKFEDLKWITEVKQGYLSIDATDYEKMNDIYGPDLTSIPRQRFSQNRPVKKPPQPRALNGYNLFFKEMSSVVPEGEKKFAWIADQWKVISDEKKQEYNERAKNMPVE